MTPESDSGAETLVREGAGPQAWAGVLKERPLTLTVERDAGRLHDGEAAPFAKFWGEALAHEIGAVRELRTLVKRWVCFFWSHVFSNEVMLIR